ncbi:SDR family oxidoreductase [Streptomyces longwoodensis]|uniref:SDR family NAD(P)-dependent oxidoreductase n=1 Tax=Streptomyces longwoodensis TaxID=68231 RepID=UPI003400448D
MASALTMFRLEGVRALVTGASRGIGKAVATGLADAGCDLALAARTREALADTARAVVSRGRKAVLLDGDLVDANVAAGLPDRAASALGGLDVIVHNASVLPTAEDGATLLAPFQETHQQEWDTVMAVNLDATAALCRAAYPHLVSSDRASLVIMSSIAGLTGGPRIDAYAATKAAQLSLTRSLALSWARQGIRVNAVCPGWTRTDMTEIVTGNEATADWLTSHIPIGRWAAPEEVVGPVVFLASPAASYVTGHALVADGGISVPEVGLSGFAKPPSPFTAD